MKKLLYILFFFFPIVAIAQLNLYKDSPLDYAWKNVGNAGFSAEEATFTSIAFSPSDGQPYVAFEDYEFYLKATVMKFDGTNWVNIGNGGFSASLAEYTSLAFSPSGQPYVAYEDAGTGDSSKATVMKFDGTNWVNDGNAGFSAGDAWYTSLAFSLSGQPYVAFQDLANSQKATVMKFDGTNWMNVGSAGFSARIAWFTSLAFSPSGQPYIAYSDYGKSDKATVMKFDGTNWEYVGNAGFTAGQADWTSLAFSPSSEPYVAYKDYGNSGKATVMKFNGANWVNVGNAGYSAGQAGYTSLAFNPSNSLPYVAYEDCGNSCKATVMKFDGTSWINVGSAGFSVGETNNTSLAFSPSGEPYVAYQDWGNSYKATVMKYDSVYVGINEPQESKLLLYPNPATDKITIKLSGMTQGGNLTIVDIEGQQLITRQITEPKTHVDINSLPSGVYFVRVTNEKTVEVGKFVKQ
jgi:hypothetical protein